MLSAEQRREVEVGFVLGEERVARTVARFGVRLEAGHVVLPGSCTRAIDVRPGDDFRAGFAGLGSVALAFLPDTARHQECDT